MLTLANEHRPLTFDEVLGQEAIKTFFKNSLSQGKLRNVYMLPGLHGCGKTTVAKILARWINCDNRQGYNPCNSCPSCEASLRGQSLLTMEVDGTSQNKGEFVEKELMAWLSATPPSNKYHVAIIDEFHRIKDPARSMFLPFLEFMDVERPRSIVILCTTDLKSIDKALKSRMARPGTFQGLSPEQVVGRYAARLGLDDETCKLILKVSEGSMRQFWMTYDVVKTICGDNPVSKQAVLDWAGGLSDAERAQLWTAIRKKDRKKIQELWTFWMQSNKAGFEFAATQLLEDLDRMVVENPDEDAYVDAHQELATALTFATHPAAKIDQLVLAALYRMTLPGVINKASFSAPAKQPDPEPVQLPATVTPAKDIAPPKPEFKMDASVFEGLGDDDDLPHGDDPWAPGHPESPLAVPEPPLQAPGPTPVVVEEGFWDDLGD